MFPFDPEADIVMVELIVICSVTKLSTEVTSFSPTFPSQRNIMYPFYEARKIKSPSTDISAWTYFLKVSALSTMAPVKKYVSNHKQVVLLWLFFCQIKTVPSSIQIIIMLFVSICCLHLCIYSATTLSCEHYFYLKLLLLCSYM